MEDVEQKLLGSWEHGEARWKGSKAVERKPIPSPTNASKKTLSSKSSQNSGWSCGKGAWKISWSDRNSATSGRFLRVWRRIDLRPRRVITLGIGLAQQRFSRAAIIDFTSSVPRFLRPFPACKSSGHETTDRCATKLHFGRWRIFLWSLITRRTNYFVSVCDRIILLFLICSNKESIWRLISIFVIDRIKRYSYRLYSSYTIL